MKSNIKNLLFIAGILGVILNACKDKTSTYNSFLLPETGTRIAVGEELPIKLLLNAETKPDSIVYLVNGDKIAIKMDTVGFKLATSDLKMGNHLLTAKVYAKGMEEELTSNFIVVAKSAPIEYGFKVIQAYPHDPTSYVEGFEYHDGYLYESSGLDEEKIKLRKTALNTGQIVQKVVDNSPYFAEGITVIGDKIIQLTYTDPVGYIYDKQTFKKLGEFPYPNNRQGWGLAFDGEKVLNTDGSSNIYYLDKATYQTIGYLEVYDNNGSVGSLNELEYINGKIYANVYLTTGPYANKILIIDPQSGAVEATINLIGLNPEKGKESDSDYILNGIAWDAKGKRLFVTGKKWSKLFHIEMVKK